MLPFSMSVYIKNISLLFSPYKYRGSKNIPSFKLTCFFLQVVNNTLQGKQSLLTKALLLLT